MHKYINFCFQELEMNETVVTGVFDAPDYCVKCRFRYNMQTKAYEVWDHNKPKEDMLPLPFYWLDKRFQENGRLGKTECKISF